MIKIDNLIKTDKKFKTDILLQIHDELIFETPRESKDYVEKIIKKAMTSVSSSDHHVFSIPLEVTVNSGHNWGETH